MPPITQGDIKQMLTLYFGKRQEWFDFWQTQRMKEGGTIQIQQFVHKNWLRKIIKLWSSNLPLFKVVYNPNETTDGKPKGSDTGQNANSSPEEKDPQVQAFDDWLDEFFGRPGWEGQQDFWGSLAFERVLLALTGRWVVKLPVGKDGKVMPTRMRAQTILPMGDGRTVKGVRGFQFFYQIQDPNAFTSGTSSGFFVQEKIWLEPDPVTGKNRVKWMTTLSDNDSAEIIPLASAGKDITGKKTESPVPPDVDFLPLAFLAYEPQEDNPMGFPIAFHLVDACLDICSVLTDVRKANKKTAAQQLVLLNSKGDGIDLDSALELHDDGPGTKADAKYIGGGKPLDSLEKEYEEHKRDIHESASVPYPGKDDISTQPGKSGKAQVVLSAPMRAEISNYEEHEGAFIADLVVKAFNLEHPGQRILTEEITVQYDAFDSPDPDEKIKRAEFFETMSLERQAMREMGLDDDTIDELLAERDEDKAASQAEFVAGVNQPKEIDPNTGAPQPVKPPLPPTIPPPKSLEPKLPAA